MMAFLAILNPLHGQQRSSSRDRKDKLALDVALGGAFMRLAGICKGERAVDGYADPPGIEQAPEFRELPPFERT
jgi:hypothetical protein